jgi:hypothetical protein
VVCVCVRVCVRVTMMMTIMITCVCLLPESFLLLNLKLALAINGRAGICFRKLALEEFTGMVGVGGTCKAEAM